MDRDDLIDILYNFIISTFSDYYWKSATQYSYSSTDFAIYNSYNDFCFFQEMVLYSKSDKELLLLINIKEMIETLKINVMESRYMLPSKGYSFVFDTNGSLIICDKK